jgi:hypothetical protein
MSKSSEQSKHLAASVLRGGAMLRPLIAFSTADTSLLVYECAFLLL